MPYSSKAKTPLICALAIFFFCQGQSLVISGEINIFSQPGQDTIMEINPNAPPTAPGTVQIESEPGQDRYLEINPPLPPETEEDPLLIIPKIQIKKRYTP